MSNVKYTHGRVLTKPVFMQIDAIKPESQGFNINPAQILSITSIDLKPMDVPCITTDHIVVEVDIADTTGSYTLYMTKYIYLNV